MKTKTVVGAILGLLSLGLVSVILFPPGRPRYRLGERLQAQTEFSRVPSEGNKQKVAEEFALLRKHEKIKSLISLGVSVPAYVLFVLYLWKNEK
ncbi:MAG: hypothetical protein PF904_17665 [Kiritimatiellae bacterium]|jgi:hypothetical protein|nr:hypothetical protein [Kiritimatiellia bacterium]